MRSAALPLVVLLFSSAASAQFTLLPQIGFDNSKTTIRYNDGSSFAPLGREASPWARVRLDYRFKSGHGPFVGVSTSAAPVDYRFSDPATGDRQYRAGRSDQLWRLEGGWQYSSKPITLGHSKATSATLRSSFSPDEPKSHCGNYASRSHCGGSYDKARQTRNSAWNLRVQPFAGAAYIPSLKEDLSTQSGSYTYRAGNWNTALLAGSGFEFGRGNRRLFTISVQYLKGLGNLGEKTLVSQSGAKTTTTRLQSTTTGWSVGLGLPFTLGGQKTASRPRMQPAAERNKCGQYREYHHQCSRRVI